MATYRNLYIDQGASFSELITVEDVSGGALNLNLYTVTAYIKRGYESTSYTEFEVTIPTNNQIKLFLHADATAALKAGRHVYDVIIEDDCQNVIRVQGGIVIVEAGVTPCQ